MSVFITRSNVNNKGDRWHLSSTHLSLPLSLLSVYPDITSDAQRHEYKKEFDADLKEYKHLCAEMDDINDQMNKLSRQLDTLDEASSKYQVRDQRQWILFRRNGSSQLDK